MIEIPKLSISGDIHDKKGNFRALVFVHDLLNQTPRIIFKTPIGESQGGDVIWRYVPEWGIYQPDGKYFVETAIQKYTGEDSCRSWFGEAVKHMQVATYTPQREFDEDPGSIVLQNYEIDTVTMDLKPFNPAHNHKNRLPVKYDPDAKCPNFEKFITDILPPDDIAVIQEMFGYCLIKSNRFEKCFILQGVGDNGKTKLLNVLNKLLGDENLSHESIYDMAATRWSKAELFHKLANTAADIAPDEVQRTGTFKMLTGTDPITAEKKNQNKFSYINYAKLIFSCNQMPTTPDNSYAFFKRFVIIKFLRIFIRGVDMDENIEEKITTPEELSGVLNWALIGLSRLLMNKGFSKSMTSEETKELMLKMANPILAFIGDCIDDEDTEHPEARIEVYRAYRQYCKKFGYVPESDKKFYGEIRNEIRQVKESQLRIGDARPIVFKGITLRCSRCEKYEGVKGVKGVKPPSYCQIFDDLQKGGKDRLDSLDSLDTSKNTVKNTVDSVDGHDANDVKTPFNLSPVNEVAPEPFEGDPPPLPPGDHTCEVCGSSASFRYAARWLCKKHLDEMIPADRDMGGASA